jgi:hypothetical protein
MEMVLMYGYILEQWKVANVTETWVQACVTKGYITADQCTTILATIQTPGDYNTVRV